MYAKQYRIFLFSLTYSIMSDIALLDTLYVIFTIKKLFFLFMYIFRWCDILQNYQKNKAE